MRLLLFVVVLTGLNAWAAEMPEVILPKTAVIKPQDWCPAGYPLGGRDPRNPGRRNGVA